jgi:hypothetical protein
MLPCSLSGNMCIRRRPVSVHSSYSCDGHRPGRAMIKGPLIIFVSLYVDVIYTGMDESIIYIVDRNEMRVISTTMICTY